MKLPMMMVLAVSLLAPPLARASIPRASHTDPGMLGMFPTEVADASPAPIAAAVSAAPAMVADVAVTQTAAHAPASGPSLISQALSFLGDHLGGVVGLLGLLLSTPFVASHLDAKRKREIGLAVYHGYHIAADTDAELAPGGAKSTADKIAAVLKAADDFCLANGWRPLKGDDTASSSAAALVQSIAGQAKVGVPAEKIAAANP